jgi:hypothetical protein
VAHVIGILRSNKPSVGSASYIVFYSLPKIYALFHEKVPGTQANVLQFCRAQSFAPTTTLHYPALGTVPRKIASISESWIKSFIAVPWYNLPLFNLVRPAGAADGVLGGRRLCVLLSSP